MKRIFSLVAAAILVIGSFSVNAFAADDSDITVITDYSENFSNMTEGEFPTGWIDIISAEGTAFASVAADPADSSNKVLKLWDNGTSSTTVAYKIPDMPKPFEVSMRVMHGHDDPALTGTVNASHNWFSVHGTDALLTNGNIDTTATMPLARMSINESASPVWRTSNSTNGDTATKISAAVDTWYNVKMVFTDEGKTEYWIDDAKAAEFDSVSTSTAGYEEAGDGTEIARYLAFRTNQSRSSYCYYDDIRVTYLGIREAVDATLAEDSAKISNVKFLSGDSEVFTLPESGSVSAKVFFDGAAPGSEAFVLGAYEGNRLSAVSFGAKEVFAGFPTVTTGAVDVTESTSYLKLMVWDSAALEPLSTVRTLTDTSRNARIESASITLGSNTYNAAINHDLKTVRFFVPTYSGKGYILGSAADTATTPQTVALSNADNAYEYEKPMTKADFDKYVKKADLTLSIAEGAESTIISGPANMNRTRHCIVTAPDGTQADYEISIIETTVQYSTNFDKATLGGGLTADAVQIADTDAWKYKSNYGALSQFRTHLPTADGRASNGDGYWKFDNGVVYDETGNYLTDTEIHTAAFSLPAALAEEEPPVASPVATNLHREYDEDGTTETGRYFSFIMRDKTVTSSYRPKLTYTMGTGDTIADEAPRYATAGFKFKLSEYNSEFATGVRFKISNSGEVMLRAHETEDGTLVKLQARAIPGTGSESGQNPDADTEADTNSDIDGFTSVGSKFFNPDEWQMLQLVITDCGVNDSGSCTAVAEYYLNGEYIGYTYSNSFAENHISNTHISVESFSGAQCELFIDDMYVLYSIEKAR